MANIQTANTNTTSLTNTIKTYYDRLFLESLYPNLVFYQFGMKKPLPKNEGTSVLWNRLTKLAMGFQLSQGVPTSTANALSTTTVSAIIAQYGGFTAISDLVSLTSISQPMELAAEALGKQAALTVDSVVRNAIWMHEAVTNASAHFLVKSSASELFDYQGRVSGAMRTVSSTEIIAVSDIRTAVFGLRKLDVAPYEGNDYIAIVHPEIAEDICGDSTFVNWHQYAGNQDAITNLYNGEIGKIYGCRFVQTTNAPISAGSNAGASPSSLAYGTTIFGKGFFGVTELDGGIKMQGPVTGPSKSDPLNQETVYGWKANLTAKILNCSAGVLLVTGSGQTGTTTDMNLSEPTAY